MFIIVVHLLFMSSTVQQMINEQCCSFLRPAPESTRVSGYLTDFRILSFLFPCL